MSCRIAPSILSFDPSRIREAMSELSQTTIDRIHFDVMDGQFVPPITFGDSLVKSLRDTVGVPFEAHLMTLTPEKHFDAFTKAGCERIYFHVEAAVHVHRLAQSLRQSGVEAGLALNPGTPASAVEAVIDDIDAVLVMTVNPGWGGQDFIESMLPKIRKIRAMRGDVDIEVDGGVDPETLPRVAEAGANLFVVGSYLARTKPMAQAVASLHQACG